MAIDKDKNTQVLVTFPNDLLDEIEMFWHENKLKSRSETIRRLVEIGLEKKNTEK
ncbi:ribbon-helix-helix domain-containing protein [Paenibacillus sp. T2-29]|uniref:ribbon-helix-helix domain-containing protein n=1 Tax=Paenibacillus TaxID=44249 RepID=UPI0039BCD28B